VNKRNTLLAIFSLVTLPLHSFAQSAGRIYRLGMLRATTPAPEVSTALLDTLRERGYIEGRNLIIERRFASGQLDRLPGLARELVQLRVDAIMCLGPAATVRAGREATSTTPIIMFGNFDPVALGLVTNLARPEANVTGILISADGTLAGKRLEFLRELAPRAARIGMLAPDVPSFRLQLQETQKAAAALKLELEVVKVRGGDYSGAFATISSRRPDALVVGASTFFMRDRKAIIALAAKHRLPAVYEWPEQVRDGGLIAYGTSLDGLYARIGAYADQLFRGKKPADLPVERPTEFELVINLKTAKALGLKIPQSLLLRADRLIE
jgi:putative ABC transport system substrate-binding protein